MASTVQCPPACRDTLRCRPDITRSREWLRRAWAFFLGGFGAHNFYIGLRGRAIVQLCVTLGSVAIIFLGAVVMLIGLGDPNVSYDDDEVMTGLGALLFIGGCLLVLAVTIWAFVELFMILAGNGRYGQDRYGVPMR